MCVVYTCHPLICTLGNRLIRPLLGEKSAAPYEFRAHVEDAMKTTRRTAEQSSAVLAAFLAMHRQLNMTLLNAVIGPLSTQLPQTAAKVAAYQYEATVPALEASNPAVLAARGRATGEEHPDGGDGIVVSLKVPMDMFSDTM